MCGEAAHRLKGATHRPTRLAVLPPICARPRCVAFYGSWFDAFPDAHVEVHGIHIIDDLAVEEGTFTGTHKGVLHGPMGDIPPTGRPVRVGYIQVLRFRNGKHVSFNLMFDRLLMLEQLGLIPAPAA